VNKETSNLVYRLITASPNLQTTNCPWKRRGPVTWPSRQCCVIHQH